MQQHKLHNDRGVSKLMNICGHPVTSTCP